MKRTLIGLVGSLLALVFLVGLAAWGIGRAQPREHQASATVDIAAPVHEVWDVVRDYSRLHHWAPDLAALQRLDDVAGNPVYRLEQDDQVLTFTMVQSVPPRSLVVDLAADPPVFGGRWTYELEPSEVGTQVTITEDGWVEPALFRFALWLTNGHDDTVVAHAEALRAHLEGDGP